jgi:hypothetical protein
MVPDSLPLHSHQGDAESAALAAPSRPNFPMHPGARPIALMRRRATSDSSLDKSPHKQHRKQAVVACRDSSRRWAWRRTWPTIVRIGTPAPPTLFVAPAPSGC